MFFLLEQTRLGRINRRPRLIFESLNYDLLVRSGDISGRGMLNL